MNSGLLILHLSLVCPRLEGLEGGDGQPRGIRLRKTHVIWDFDIYNDPRGGKFDFIHIILHHLQILNSCGV